MNKIEGRPAFPSDVLVLAKHMRASDVAEAAASGLEPLQGIITSMQRSASVTTYVAGPKVIAMVGLAVFPNRVVAPWLLCTESVADYPITLLKESLNFMEVAKRSGMCLHNTVFAENESTVKYLRRLGFYVDEENPRYRPQTGAPFLDFISDYRPKEMIECVSYLQ